MTDTVLSMEGDFCADVRPDPDAGVGADFESAFEGGLGGGAGIGDTLLLSFILPVSDARTVDAEDEDDSRTVERASRSRLLGLFSDHFRGTGCLLRVGLCCTGPRASLEDAERRMPGEWEDIEVGVDVTLKGPGE